VIQLVYVSVAAEQLSESQVIDLRAQAQKNNARDEITGILVTQSGRFMQAIEGPQSTVEDTFLRIIVDPRHHSLALLSRRSIVKREFGEWEMWHCRALKDCPLGIENFTTLLRSASADMQQTFLRC